LYQLTLQDDEHQRRLKQVVFLRRMEIVERKQLAAATTVGASRVSVAGNSLTPAAAQGATADGQTAQAAASSGVAGADLGASLCRTATLAGNADADGGGVYELLEEWSSGKQQVRVPCKHPHCHIFRSYFWGPNFSASHLLAFASPEAASCSWHTML
jgi:hypothetical protein